MDTIFKTLRVKATTVSVRLRIYLRALKITNKLFGAVAGETVAVIRQTKFVLVSFLFKHG
jgi:hypothetical protein